MSNASTAIRALQTQLKSSSNLSYVNDNYIFLGHRDNIDHAYAISINPDENQEIPYLTTVVDNDFFVEIIGYVKNLNSSLDDTIADSTNKGILDLEKDIKLAIDADKTLNSSCDYARIEPSIRYNYIASTEAEVILRVKIMLRSYISDRT